MEEHLSRGNKIAREALDGLRAIEEERNNKLHGRYILAKLADLFTIFLSLIITGIVLYTFSEGVFEGFISTVVGYVSIRHFFKKRSGSFLSWFFTWF